MISKYPARSAVFLTLVLTVFIASTVTAQRQSKPGQKDGTTARMVAQMVSSKHISRAPINDDTSKRLTDRFIESLDPQKLYLTSADVMQLSRRQTLLDDDLRNGDVSYAFQAFDLYLARLETRIKYAQSLIDQEYDFTVDEEIVIDADDLPWAGTAAELNERWRKRIKFDLLTLKIDGTETAEARDRLHKRYKMILSTMKQTQDFEKLEMFLTSLTHTLDPHSTYMAPETLDDFRISMELKLQGIGAALRSEDGYTIVADIVDGGAAEADGRLKVGDKITAVDSKADDNWTDVVEMKLSRVVRFIRGDKGTKVRLEVKTPEKDEKVIYELTRKTIELKSAEVKGEIIDVGTRVDGRSGRIGVISLPSFYRDFRGAALGLPDFKSARKDVEKVLQQFSTQSLDAVIVDLRFNGGGALVEAVELSGLFVSKGPIVQTKEQNGEIRPHVDEDPSIWYKGPLVVLCNRLSASASEIFAGAIKDWGRGIVIGDTTTHGKGTVQNVMPVSSRMRFLGGDNTDRGAIKLTIQQFYRVNGDSTQVNGVRSDIVLPSILDHREVGEAQLDNALPFDRINPAIQPTGTARTPQLIATLAQRSQARVAADEEFQKVNSDIKLVVERQNRKTISLNEAVLRKERDEAKSDDDDEDEDEDKDKEKEDPPVYPDTSYNDEVLNITMDYVELLKSVKTANN
ncbi:carboxy terminal-processing peptidase [bacterium]|nr:carboxy terminal-processing peptidase [bacterium]